MSPDRGQVVDVGGRQLRLTHLDRVLWPATTGSPATTKADLLTYLARVAPALLTQLADRPLTRVRWPDGVGGERFFAKNTGAGAPDWLRTVAVAGSGSRGGPGVVVHPVLEDVAGLVWAANGAALEFHTPQWRVGAGERSGGAGGPDEAVRRPDRLVVDLDPGPGTGLAECAALAHRVAERLADDGLVAVPVTSGSKGLQLYAPVAGRQDAVVVHAYARRLAEGLARDLPWVTAVMTRSVRTGRVLLDWSQNSPAKTTITPWSPRGREGASAAVPRRWSEVGDGLAQLTMAQAAARYEAEGDPMDDGAGPGPLLPS